ncbi:hypothetical protein [uncultured Gordonia sp.]|uniref:hypothetical protein n=1 Tax=uncultured Gordonia sp. TaxID=198437 RepID=UPI00258AAE69|nr:hypothetical protein [uncultured Gordonia sp.]
MPDDPNDPADDDTNPAPEAIDALSGDMRGRWIVASQGSTHLWDLDELTYTRRPGPASPSGSFDYDGIAHRITRVTRWPRVGDQSLVWFDDPASPFDTEQFRRSSVIVAITRAPDASSEDTSTPEEDHRHERNTDTL